jgi:hypothetical protein
MRKLILATCIILLTSFCTKETEQPTACTVTHDWTYLSTIGLPNFQGNCYLVTNAQIRWAQDNGYFAANSLAPNNNECPTKAQIIAYAGGNEENFSRSTEWDALGSNSCPAMGYFYGNL